MKNLNFISLNSNQMKSIKGGIIVEHVMSYDGLLTDTYSSENVNENIDNSNASDFEYISSSVSEEWITEED